MTSPRQGAAMIRRTLPQRAELVNVALRALITARKVEQLQPPPRPP